MILFYLTFLNTACETSVDVLIQQTDALQEILYLPKQFLWGSFLGLFLCCFYSPHTNIMVFIIVAAGCLLWQSVGMAQN